MSGGFSALGDNCYTKNVCFDGKWHSQLADDGDYKIRNLETGTDVISIDKTTNVITFDPPLPAGGLTNPLTSDLDCAGFSLTDGAYGTFQFNDVAPLIKQRAMYDVAINTGAYNRQLVEGTQENFNNATTGFPTNQNCQMANQTYQQALNGVFSRRTGINLTPGLAGNYFLVGTQAGFQDSCTYDPLNMRYDPAVPNAWTAIKFSDNIGKMCPAPIGTQSKMIVSIHTHLEGIWAGASATNVLKVYVRHYRGLGVPLRDYQLSNIDVNGVDVVRSDSRYLMAFSPGLGEDVLNGDYMEVFLENDPGSPNDFNVGLFKCFIQINPCP